MVCNGYFFRWCPIYPKWDSYQPLLPPVIFGFLLVLEPQSAWGGHAGHGARRCSAGAFFGFPWGYPAGCLMENPTIKWLIWGYPPHFRETPMKFAGTERISSNFPKNCMSGWDWFLLEQSFILGDQTQGKPSSWLACKSGFGIILSGHVQTDWRKRGRFLSVWCLPDGRKSISGTLWVPTDGVNGVARPCSLNLK